MIIWRHEGLSKTQMQAMGQRLFDGLFYGTMGKCLRSSLASISADNGLRLNLRLHRTPELANLPWELLYDSANARFLALSERTPIVRYLALGQPESVTLNVQLPLRILVVLANPSEERPLDVAREWVALSEALEAVQMRNQVYLERLVPPTLQTLRLRLLTSDVHILHFVGHGLFDTTEGEGFLVFHDEEGKSHPVSAQDLAILLHNHPSLRFVYLNACQGAISGDSSVYAGVAQTLVQQGVPAALAMQRDISDAGALVFARSFYEATAAGYPIDAALTQARLALATTGSDEWAVPVLFSRSRDNLLLPGVKGSKAPDFRRLPFEPETLYIPAGTFVMGCEVEIGAAVAESPSHQVYLGAFCIGTNVVTNREYTAYIAQESQAEVPRKSGWFLRQPPAEKLEQPVVGVSWHSALDYCRWLSGVTGRSYRLPTEAEWERACPIVAHGGVEEWTSTRWGSDSERCDYPYPYRNDDGREDEKTDSHLGRFRVIRAGIDQKVPTEMHCTTRLPSDPESKLEWRGFRVLMAL